MQKFINQKCPDCNFHVSCIIEKYESCDSVFGCCYICLCGNIGLFCTICSFKFKNLKFISRNNSQEEKHLAKHDDHSICPFCNKIFTNVSELINHTDEHFLKDTENSQNFFNNEYDNINFECNDYNDIVESSLDNQNLDTNIDFDFDRNLKNIYKKFNFKTTIAEEELFRKSNSFAIKNIENFEIIGKVKKVEVLETLNQYSIDACLTYLNSNNTKLFKKNFESLLISSSPLEEETLKLFILLF
jgi:hypothetical protein